jgi:F-type H+-transporting ATPase subunit alpha
MFKKEQKPAIDVGTSVSRVGSAAQLKPMKKVAGRLKLDLAQFQELERFSEFTEELDSQTKSIIEKGKRIREILRQDDLNPYPFEKEAIIIFAGVNGSLEEIPLDRIKEFEKDLLQEMEVSHKDILAEIREKEDFTDAAQAKVLEVIKEIKKKYGSSGN